MTAQSISRTGTLPPGLETVIEIGDAPGRYGYRVSADIVHLVGMYVIFGGQVASQYYVKATVDHRRLANGAEGDPRPLQQQAGPRVTRAWAARGPTRLPLREKRRRVTTVPPAHERMRHR